jgi:hypothetical protein
LKVNFQQAGGEIPEGYLPDYGEVYGDRGDGWTYGWDRDIQGDTRDRGSGNAPDQRYDTVVHLQKGADAVWEIALPNGVYDIFLVGGDPGYTDQTNNFDVEGVIVEAAEVGVNFDEFNVTVVVADGRLTIKPAPGSSNSKLLFLDILGGVELVKAYKPTPDDGALHEDTWVSLSWRAGDHAVSHDVYLSDNLDDVDNGTGDAPRGNQVATDYILGFPGFAYPDGLVPGTTYYWRIDEVNEADPNSPWRGDIWSFSIPPKTAYSPDPIDGAEFIDLDATFGWTPGYGAKLHTVYLGDSFEDVDSAAGGAPVGAPSYKPASPLEAEKVYYWRVDEFDIAETHKGDVWGFTTPGAVGNSQPANGDVDVAIIAALSWTPADTAASSDLYFGADADAVKNATAASPEYAGNKTLGSESYDPGKLVLDADYYWRVDAVYADKTVKGLLWSFATADFISVDDFEAYNDVELPDPNSNIIFNSWIDGFGTTTNGALVGNDLPPYAEQTTVHGGDQSMPYFYDNNLKTSEATLTLAYPRDWTEEGVASLSLWFRGNPDNAAERMSVALNGTAVVYHDDPTAAQAGVWTEWVIPLQAFADQGVNLSSVNTISIGFGDSVAAGGSGTVNFDDIRLYRSEDAASQ